MFGIVSRYRPAGSTIVLSLIPILGWTLLPLWSLVVLVFAVIAAINSVIAFYYYAAVVRRMWFHEAEEPVVTAEASPVPIALTAAKQQGDGDGQRHGDRADPQPSHWGSFIFFCQSESCITTAGWRSRESGLPPARVHDGGDNYQRSLCRAPCCRRALPSTPRPGH